MKSRKKKEKTAVEESDVKIESVVDELAEAVVEDLHDNHADTLEPFEQYAHKVRGKIHSDFDAFRSRFVKGYQALIEEIVHEQEQDKQSPPKSGNIRH